MSTRIITATLAACLTFPLALSGRQADVFDRVKHEYAVSEAGVKIHYAALGTGPLVVMIHGFPDFWYSWRHSMAALSDTFQVVAIDQRGYNLSDKPKGVESYDVRLLVADVAAVIRHAGRDTATIVGHDWGGLVAWQFAMTRPEMTERLVVLNLPHPSGLLRELKSNPEQIANSEYARVFQRGSPADATVFFGKPMTPETLSGWVSDPAARKRYIEAFQRSDFEAMLNYYKANYPKASGADAPPPPLLPKVSVPVLMFHGLNDRALHRRPGGYLGLAGERSHAGDGAGRRPFRPAGRGRTRHVDDEMVADLPRGREVTNPASCARSGRASTRAARTSPPPEGSTPPGPARSVVRMPARPAGSTGCPARDRQAR